MNTIFDQIYKKYDLATAKCPKCSNTLKMGFNKGEKSRYTYCRECRKAVMWKKISEQELES